MSGHVNVVRLLPGERRKITARYEALIILTSDSAAVKMYVPIGYLWYVQCHTIMIRILILR